MIFSSKEEAEINWNFNVKICKDKDEKFVDPSFLPCDISIFIDPEIKSDIKWLRPYQIKTDSRFFNIHWTLYSQPDYSDVKQGELGDCWLLSSLAVILEHPELLKRIIITKEFCPQGCYLVRLCKNGEWQTVILDDLFPCDRNGYLIYSQANRKQLWVPLIEKAMAKLNGSYESLTGGETVEGLSALTGYPCDSIRLEPSSNEEEIDFKVIWARMLSMKEAGFFMNACTNRTDIRDDQIYAQDLKPKHAYSVLAVFEENMIRYIKFRDPWGQLSTDLRSHANVFLPFTIPRQSLNRNDGVVRMTFQDFAKYFSSVHICKSRLDWKERRVSGYFSSEGTREMLAFKLKVIETCEIDIGLFHKTIKNRRENGDLDLCFVVLKSNGRKNSVGKLVVSSKRAVRRFVGCEHIFEPGEYLIVPCSFNFWYSPQALETNNNLYNLVIHSTKDFYLEQEMHLAFLMADTMIQLVTTLGSRALSELENACIYILAKGYSGIIIVAENINENSYLHVELDCEQSSNVVSTRQALLTKDSVPPLHRQVLILLTQLEGSNSYSIESSIKYRQSLNPYLNTWPGNEGRMVTNLPSIGEQTFILHLPRKVFNHK